MTDTSDLYDFNTFSGTNILLQYPNNIHFELVDLVEKIIGEKSSPPDENLFRRTSFFSAGFVNSSSVINSRLLYTHTIYLPTLKNDAQIKSLDSELKMKYLPESESFKNSNPGLFEEDYPE